MRDATGLAVLPAEGIDTVFVDSVLTALPVEGIDALLKCVVVASAYTNVLKGYAFYCTTHIGY